MAVDSTLIRPLLIVAVASFLTAPVRADDTTDTGHWLMKMSQAARQLSYRGTFVYQQGGQLEAMRIIHRVDADGVQERLVSLNGSPREVIRNNAEVRCYLPDENSVVVEHRKANDNSFPAILPEQLREFDAHYSVSLGKSGRVTDRDAQLVVISPRDEYRYGYYLWAAADTGLLLAADLVDLEGQPVERFMFTDLDIGGPIDAKSLQPRTQGKDLVWHRERDENDGAASKQNWQVKDLPPGFSLAARITRMNPMQDAPMEHMVYSDGLAAVSVFIEKHAAGGTDTDPSRLDRMGAVHAYKTMVDGYKVTVVGEVPGATVARMGRSVTLER